ncbi:hypothetical protein MHYP_G00183350 [Metynnis hypsauchen]
MISSSQWAWRGSSRSEDFLCGLVRKRPENVHFFRGSCCLLAKISRSLFFSAGVLDFGQPGRQSASTSFQSSGHQPFSWRSAALLSFSSNPNLPHFGPIPFQPSPLPLSPTSPF